MKSSFACLNQLYVLPLEIKFPNNTCKLLEAANIQNIHIKHVKILSNLDTSLKGVGTNRIQGGGGRFRKWDRGGGRRGDKDDVRLSKRKGRYV